MIPYRNPSLLRGKLHLSLSPLLSVTNTIVALGTIHLRCLDLYRGEEATQASISKAGCMDAMQYIGAKYGQWSGIKFLNEFLFYNEDVIY